MARLPEPLRQVIENFRSRINGLLRTILELKEMISPGTILELILIEY